MIDIEKKAREIAGQIICNVQSTGHNAFSYSFNRQEVEKLITQALKEQSESRSVKIPIRSFMAMADYLIDANFGEIEEALTQAYNEGFKDACEKFNIKIEE